MLFAGHGMIVKELIRIHDAAIWEILDFWEWGLQRVPTIVYKATFLVIDVCITDTQVQCTTCIHSGQFLVSTAMCLALFYIPESIFIASLLLQYFQSVILYFTFMFCIDLLCYVHPNSDQPLWPSRCLHHFCHIYIMSTIKPYFYYLSMFYLEFSFFYLRTGHI